MTSSIKKNTYITFVINISIRWMWNCLVALQLQKGWSFIEHTLDYKNINSKFDILQHASNSTDIHFWNKQCLLAANLASLEPHHRKPRESSTVGSKIGRPRCPLISPSSSLSPSLPHSPPQIGNLTPPSLTRSPPASPPHQDKAGNPAAAADSRRFWKLLGHPTHSRRRPARCRKRLHAWVVAPPP